jgi:hypothetical protein
MPGRVSPAPATTGCCVGVGVGGLADIGLAVGMNGAKGTVGVVTGLGGGG